MRHPYFLPTLLLLIGLLAGGPVVAQPATVSTVFVVGGRSQGPADYLHTLRAVATQAAPLGERSTLVLLDDHLGTLLLADGSKSQASAALLAQLHAFPGRLVIVPGGADGQAGDAPASRLLATPAGRPDALLPDSRCPDPLELRLDGQHTLVVLNTAWWLRGPAPADQPGNCTTQDPAAALTQLDEVLRRNQGRHVLLVGQQALALAHRRLPLLPNPRYELLRTSMRSILEKYPGLTYVSAQGARHARYDEEYALHYLRSGPTPVPAADTFAIARATPPPPMVAVVPASTHYRAGRFRRWLQGGNYRREWQQPITVPVLNLATAYGGLTPLKRGGGLQTQSLRLRAANGQEFVLRSIEKNTTGAVPDYLHHTLAAAIVQYQISAAHPYAALLVPPLAEAAGVGHTNPQVVLVPDDPRLGIYRREFAGTLALLEARDPDPPKSFSGQSERKKYGTPTYWPSCKPTRATA
jgi:hypothetical protein